MSETVEETFSWHRVKGRRHMLHSQSVRQAAWSCIGPEGCTCWQRIRGAPDCRGRRGKHCEEWKYRLYAPVARVGGFRPVRGQPGAFHDHPGWSLVDVAFKVPEQGPNRSAIELEEDDEDEDEEDDEAPIEWPVRNPLICVLELTVHTNIYIDGWGDDEAIWPVLAYLHLPNEAPVKDGVCDLLHVACDKIDMRLPKQGQWREMVAWDDDTWEKTDIDDMGRVITAPFERGEKFWDWMTETLSRGIQAAR